MSIVAALLAFILAWACFVCSPRRASVVLSVSCVLLTLAASMTMTQASAGSYSNDELLRGSTVVAAGGEANQESTAGTVASNTYGYDVPGLLRVSHAVVATNSVVDDILPKPDVTDPKLQNVVDDLYKGTTNPGRVGTGTTADAVRAEFESGQATAGKFHFQKAEQYSNALRSLLKKGNLGAQDRLVAQSLLDVLQNALKGKP